ncbi:ATP-binding cassette sub-family B member 9 [Toxocara canis]|uniref:ABC-type antigen peptide transporter n=1 Tax=Toxocara canis TaxID=6265 RepID=A0A0B2V538_TOXCA|nr:ATP-binding cassette sub-family B member 9 [Toxocara canis]
MAEWYSGAQALFVAIGFATFDMLMNIFGLAWNGKFFTVDNIVHWFDLENYQFRKNPVDFLGVALVRVCILLGGGVGVYANPCGGPAACDKYSNLVFAILLLIVAFSPSKLLAFYEDINLKFAVGDWILMICNLVFAILLLIVAFSPSKLLAFYEDINLKFAVGDWILMIWCVFASLFTQAIWLYIFARVREPEPGTTDERIFEDDEYTEEDEKLLQQREAIQTLLRLFSYMLKEWAFYLLAFTFLILYSLSRVFIPYYTGEVVASVFGAQGSYAELHKTVAIMAFLSFSGAVFGGLRGGSFTYAQARIDRRIRDDLFRSLVKQEIGFFDANKTGEICSRLNADCMTMSNTLSLYVNVLSRNLTMLVGSVIFMFFLSWRLSMVTLIAIPMIFLVSKVYGVYYDQLSEETQSSVAKANDVAEEVISAIRTVKSFACEKFEALRFLSFLDITLAIGTRKAIAHVGFVWTSEFLQMGILIVVLWYGGHLVLKDEVESRLLVSFLLYQFQLGENLRELGEVWNGLMQAVGASRKVFELIDRKPQVDNHGRIRLDNTISRLEGKIEFKNVKFSYPIRPDLLVMRDISFTVNPGEVVALVGPSGSGKSSLIAMMEHFYEPTSGQVLLDGIPVRDYDHKFLHTKVALVGQEPVLYARSVRENIAYGIDNITDEEIQRAAILSNAHTFIMETTDGYETDVGEKGSQMSGGQKQRIAIARALARDPVVLLLDEATSALDSESERLVQEAISKNLSGHTVLVVAHRLSTVENADKIIVINHGKVEQTGIYKELAETEGLFQTLVQKQLKNKTSDENEESKPQANGLPPTPRSRRIHITSPASSTTQTFLGTSFASGSSFL